ncbi:baseplate assembly protein [Pasteurellaceae bacterium 15-036681]|nr:baseplate assembly protein [Pasteurellaceae bacterium 15-036681]
MNKLLQRVKSTAQGISDGVRSAFRGTLTLVKSSGDIQHVQVTGLADETLSDVEFMQQFGLTSVPPAGTEVVVIPVGGKTTHSIVIATENGSFRVKNLKNGEVALYDSSGSTIILKNGRVIEVDCDTFKLNCKSFQVTATDSAKFSTPQLETDKVFTAQGQINGNGGMAVQGGSGASFSGSVKQQGGSFTTDGDVTAGTVSLKNHGHENDGRGKPIA